MTNRLNRRAGRPNSSNLAIVALLLVVLGCSCPRALKELSRAKSTPPPRSTPISVATPDRASTPGLNENKGDYDITLEKFNKISTGTSRSDVERLLGGKGAEVTSTTGGGVRFTVVKWEGEKYSSIIITFRNDKVSTKTQVGLK